MASPEWIEIYRSYTAEELASAIVFLKRQVSVYSSQGMGSKSYTKDLSEVKNQLHAATRVQSERANQNVGSSGVVDFSQVVI